MAHENATPRPWRIRAYSRKMVVEGNIHQIADGNDFPTAFVPAWDAPRAGEVDGSVEARANAALIVEAVNAYDTLRAENERLKASLRGAHTAMTLASHLPGVDDEYDFDQAITSARAALGWGEAA